MIFLPLSASIKATCHHAKLCKVLRFHKNKTHQLVCSSQFPTLKTNKMKISELAKRTEANNLTTAAKEVGESTSKDYQAVSQDNKESP